MAMFGPEIEGKARMVIETAISQRLRLATAESCTGGLVAGALTDVAGSSATFERGFVTYSNAAKSELLDIPLALIMREGAVSQSVARAMAKGAVLASRADLAVSITGIAGPGGGSSDKPIGLVHFAVFSRSFERHVEKRFRELGRTGIRLASVGAALDLLLAALSEVRT